MSSKEWLGFSGIMALIIILCIMAFGSITTIDDLKAENIRYKRNEELIAKRCDVYTDGSAKCPPGTIHLRGK